MTADRINESGEVWATVTFSARWVFLAAGSLGTTRLLVESRAKGLLPGITPEVGRPGLERTVRIISAAGLLRAITFFAFASSQGSFIQMLGLGTGLAIVLDATLVRGVLVPALMVMMGRFGHLGPSPRNTATGTRFCRPIHRPRRPAETTPGRTGLPVLGAYHQWGST
ncbi:MMPL family transporter [Jidongwangia harbinensis]|uniref:MMPL family transporter n=1 Tax=Jidongwangia harbinensis TaxID=2878561 RepID=UPI001CD993CA|nr:MMPL family transporter [Jidongwangia harbinensis]MCA2217468.1 MMPL family transporter [Jidongwangia harbinensis]